MHSTRERGQAAVETALTMPLLVFLVLGTTQLFLLLQARILAQHAAYRAVRAGSLNQGDCIPMMHQAILTVLPTIEDTSDLSALKKAWNKHKDNRVDVYGHKGPLIELVRESPRPGDFNGAEDLRFDDPTRPGGPMTLEIRMVYWYYMKIPYANRLMSWMFLAHFGLKQFNGQNPLVYTDVKTKWKKEAGRNLSNAQWPGGKIGPRMRNWSNKKHYLFPIEVNAAMRMMTPARRQFFNSGPMGGRGCPLKL